MTTKLAGQRQSRKAQSTGTQVSIYDAYEAEMDTDGGRWAVVCEDHGSISAHDTLKQAQWFAPSPESWCEDCAAAVTDDAVTTDRSARAECGETFRDPQGNACRCTREPHAGMSGHIGVVIWENE